MSEQLFPIVKAANEAIAQVGNTARPFSGAVGATLADVWQGIVGDRVAAWRVNNAAGVNKKLMAHVAEKGLTLDYSRIPAGFAFTWFEEATRHEEPEIQELFAKILAHAAMGNEEALKRRNLDIVGRFSPSEAKLVQVIIDRVHHDLKNIKRRSAEVINWSVNPSELEGVYVKHKIIPDLLPVENLVNIGVLSENRTYHLDHEELSRRVTGLIEQVMGQSDDPYWGLYFELNEGFEYTLTLTGKSLLRALDPLLLDVPD